MSLREFVELPDVAARLKPFRPSPKKVNWLLRVAPTDGIDVRLTGTAFDYLLRFELQRRAPHATAGRWIAEYAPNYLCFEVATPGKWTGPELINAQDADPVPDMFDMWERVTRVCDAARGSLAGYLKVKEPDRDEQLALAAHAVRLAKLDRVFRDHQLDVTFEDAPPELVDELVALLAIAPYRHLVTSETMQLNPDFGAASLLVGGGDADLIVGDMLLDIKTTKFTYVRDEHLDQLFGYFLLARRAGVGPINRVGLYSARHGETRYLKTSDWTARPEFAETEKWFFERAVEQYPPVIIVRASASRSAKMAASKKRKLSLKRK